MAEKCYVCYRPKHTCYCRYLTPVDTGVKFVFLMHPKEAYKQKTGTGRLTSLSLTDSEIIIDTTFDNNNRVTQLLSDSSYYSMVLYPGETAAAAEIFDFTEKMKGRKLLVFLIDATWSQAKKMMRLSPGLQKLPRLSFSRAYRSKFRIKTQPADYCLSTIESTSYLIEELKTSGVCPPDVSTKGLLDVFERMINFQLSCLDKRVKSSQQIL